MDRFSIQAAVIHNGPTTIPQRYRLITDTFHDAFPSTVQIDGHQLNVVYEKELFTYDRRFDTLAGSNYLIGWWQSYQYFQNAAGVIRSELRMQRAPLRADREWLDRIQQANSVCLHVRRGDYLFLRDHFGLCTPAYYERAVQIIRERVENPRFFVFSDDLTWCRDQLSIEPVQFVDANGPDDAAAELWLMAACRHHIIANSSLSWWAAWLADRPDQIVIAPNPWFIGWRTPHLLLKRWIQLPQDPGSAC